MSANDSGTPSARATGRATAESDEDDMSHHPTDTSEDDGNTQDHIEQEEIDAMLESEDSNYLDAGVEFGSDDPEDDNTTTEAEQTPQPAAQTATQSFTVAELQTLLNIPPRYLRLLGLRRGRDGNLLLSPEQHPPVRQYEWPPIPDPKGQELMRSGKFGHHRRDGHDKMLAQKGIAYQVLARELGIATPRLERSAIKSITHNLIPASQPDMIINFDARAYSGQFSDDGNFFYTCSQDSKIRMFDTSNPGKWRHYKTVTHPRVQWTVSDATLSPDNRALASSSLGPDVCYALTDPDSTSEPQRLDFSQTGPGRGTSYGGFGIFSLRFSGDGREIVAGTQTSEIIVYDLEVGHQVLAIKAHDDDVNAVCYGERGSPHILYSGSDDSTVKVWDRRSLANNRPAGVFLGHTEGVTYIDSKGDGRYIVSNSKDQTMKLWDSRKLIPESQIDDSDYSQSTRFDYRGNPYPEHARRRAPRDCSTVTFRGHQVLRTLIRCHFSPEGSSDGRYVFSGSSDGKVYIWNLDGSIKGTVDVRGTTKGTRSRNDTHGQDYYFGASARQWDTCVRDVSWSPSAPMIAASSWNGWGGRTGTCTVHAWNDGMESDEAEPKMGARVTASLKHSDRYYDFSNTEQSRRRRGREQSMESLSEEENGHGIEDDDDEEEEDEDEYEYEELDEDDEEEGDDDDDEGGA